MKETDSVHGQGKTGDEMQESLRKILLRHEVYQLEKKLYPVRTRIREYINFLDLECYQYIVSLKGFGGHPAPSDEELMDNIEFYIARDQEQEKNPMFQQYLDWSLPLQVVAAYGCWFWHQVIRGKPNGSVCIKRFQTVWKKRNTK